MVFQLLTVKLHRDVLRSCFWGWGCYVATLHRCIMWSVAESPSNNGYNGDYDGWDCMVGHPWISDMNKASLRHARFRQMEDVALWIVHTLDLLRSAMSGGCPADVRRMKRLRRRQEVGRALTILKIWGETMARSLRFTETSSFSRRSSPRTGFFFRVPMGSPFGGSRGCTRLPGWPRMINESFLVHIEHQHSMVPSMV